MNDRQPVKLGKVQLDIMNLLWDLGEATAKELTDALSTQKPVAHSTVQTMLRTLEAKGAVRHEQRERTFVFIAVWERNELETTSAHDLLTRVFRGSAYGLVSRLLKDENVSKEELERLRQLIDRHASEEK